MEKKENKDDSENIFDSTFIDSMINGSNYNTIDFTLPVSNTTNYTYTSPQYINPYTINSTNTIIGSNYIIGQGASAANWQSVSLFSLTNIKGKEIVKVDQNGTISWAQDVNFDEAAQQFSKLITVSLELKAGITADVKTKMRDSVFNSLIDIAKEKGSLTAEDLTYLLEASKIIEKLKGAD